ncbi:MAG: 50S ribosomal protein L30 [Anaerolineae bacterium]
MSSEKRVKIRLVKSVITCKKDHKATVRALGLRRVGQEIVKDDSAVVRGMINSVSYLLEVTDQVE